MIWHVYGGIIPNGKLAGSWCAITLEIPAPQEMLYEYAGYPWLASFDHHPTDEEMEQLQLACGWDENA